MNAKKAKLLRKLMKQVKLERAEQITDKVKYLENVNNQKTQTVENLVNGELVTETVKIASGTITVDAATERGVYLFLKKSAS